MEYLKIPEEELGKYPNIAKSIKLLFSPEAKYTAKSFLIGTQKQTFYGNPTIMIPNSNLLDTIPDWSGDIELATNITLTDDTITGFVVVWLLMNNLYPFGFDKYTASDLFVIEEWMNYFGYNNWDKLGDVHLAIGEFIANENAELNEAGRTLVKKKYDKALEICLSEPLTQKGRNNCVEVDNYARLLGIGNYETLLMWWYGEDTWELFATIIGKINEEKRSVNETEKKWINLGLDSLISRSHRLNRLDSYSKARLKQLSEFVGRENDSSVQKFLNLPD